MIKKASWIGTLLIAMQGVLFALLAILMLNGAYQKQWKEYGKTEASMTVYIDGVSEEGEYAIEQYLLNKADSDHLFIIRRDSSLQEDGSFFGYDFGVYGDVENNEVSFSFYGKNVLNKEMLSALLRSGEEEATLGIDKGSVYSVGEIPKIRFGDQIVIKKLSALIEESNTVQGEYTIVGIKENDRRKLLSELAALCGTSEEKLYNSMRGEEVDDNLKNIIAIVFILAQMMLNTVFFIILTLRNLDKSGKLALLGWSRSAFCYELFGGFLWRAAAAVPILTMIGTVWSGWTKISIPYVGHFFLYAVLNMVFTLAEIGISVLIQMSVRPLSAIRGRFPKKVLYFLGILAYLGVSAGIVFCGLYVDSPMRMVSENAELSKRWEEVSDHQVLRNISVGNDEASFAGASKELDQDIFEWYKKIHEENGVYLVQTAYYDDEILELWRTEGIYDAVPEDAFWYFTFSQNYIQKLGIPVSDEILQAAENGTRVYLLPAGMSQEAKKAMQSWLEESSTEGIREGDIETVFGTEREIEFAEYEYEKDFFTWAAAPEEESVCRMPVIYLCSPENMTYFETESLRAIGLESYIKFEDQAVAEKYLEKDFLKQFHLDDNQIVFENVQSYIDGLQKDLMSAITWFGLVFLILTLILTGILIALAAVFRIANQEKLHVQKFLGYGFWNMYGKPMLLLGAVIAAELLLMLCAGSKFGFAVILFVAVIQLFIFAKYMTRNEIRSLCTAFKEE